MPVHVLSALDQARTQYYHFKATVIAGMGLFTDAYDLFCITPMMKIIGRIYYDAKDGNPGVTPPAVISTTVAIALLGTIIGQLVFGTLGDRVGRRRVYGYSLLLMILSSLGCGFSICRTRTCVLTSLCFYRFLLGIGIGGDYPLSATIMSEFANKRTRGSFIAGVFSMQGFGILASSAVIMTVTAIFNKLADRTGHNAISPLNTPETADLCWRIILMIGAVPATLTFYWRMTMPETARYTALVQHDIAKAASDMGRVLDDFNLETILEDTEALNQSAPPPPPPPIYKYSFFSREFLRRHRKHLFACSAAWFILDIPYYSSTLFQSQIYKPWFPPANHVNAYEEAYNMAKFQAIIAVCSTIPGYFVTMAFIDRIGRRKIQMIGFFFMAIFLFSLAAPYDRYWYDHTNVWYIVLYALTFFFSNFGPNTITFILPAELFPARFRSTCHGISGAWGKVGAIIGSVGFLYASQAKNREDLQHGYKPGIGMMNSLLILGSICLVGLILTYFYTPETKMRSLEENEAGGNRVGEIGELPNNTNKFLRSSSGNISHVVSDSNRRNSLSSLFIKSPFSSSD